MADQLCVYCGVEVADTVDHVPPRLLLAPPYPDNLITVPSCSRCNFSFQKDDEYTRFMTSVDRNAAKQRVVKTNMPAIIRSLQRPEAKRFANYLAGQSALSWILDAQGRPMGRYFEPDRNRMNATGERMARGLYFVETGQPVPASKQIRVACKSGLTAEHPDMIRFARLFRSFSDKRHKSIGDAFEYLVGFHGELSVWLLLLYDQFAWLVIVQEAVPGGNSK